MKPWFDRDSRTEKCLKDVREAMPIANPWGLLGDPRGGNEDKKDAKIGSVRGRRNSLALERGHIKHIERYQALEARKIRGKRSGSRAVVQTGKRFGIGGKR